jgi:phenylalanyl-tRNA synthetase alpha chain
MHPAVATLEGVNAVSVRLLSSEEVARALSLRDLTDPREGAHAMQRLVDDLLAALTRAWRCESLIVRAPRIVACTENYDALGYSSDAVTRDARYTRYVSATEMLRSHTSALIPGALRTLNHDCDDVVVACPGIVYRRDAIDRLHTGTPHQVDVWRVVRDRALTVGDLKEMVELVVGALLPGAEWRVESRVHPYTTDGLQIDVLNGDEWVEIGECGLAAEPVLRGARLDAHTGLAMGLGLDRVLMLRKGMADIRLLRATDPRIANQMRDLSLYRPVSSRPAIARDLSLAVAADDDVELLGDRVRDALGADADAVEAVEVLSETPMSELSDVARGRLGMRAGQKNVLVRVVLRHAERTLTRPEANELRERVFAALHAGDLDLNANRSR